jgi:4-hydroxy-tetrahydrodipicolinate reductase
VKPLRLAIVGASGRMGRAVVRLASEAGLTVVRAVAAEHKGEDAGSVAGLSPLGVPLEGGVEALASGGFDVVVDFSSPTATRELALLVGRTGGALVSGTTGLDEAAKRSLSEASARAAIFWEPNMSVGVHVLVELVTRAARSLGSAFDVEVSEMHHRMKADAPSGTAVRLAEVLEEAAGEASKLVYGRSGRPGPRPAGEIGIHAVRGGDVVGDHTVSFLGLGERLEITHRATDRDVFARGALRAAAFLAGKPPGRYGMMDLTS